MFFYRDERAHRGGRGSDRIQKGRGFSTDGFERIGGERIREAIREKRAEQTEEEIFFQTFFGEFERSGDTNPVGCIAHQFDFGLSTVRLGGDNRNRHSSIFGGNDFHTVGMFIRASVSEIGRGKRKGQLLCETEGRSETDSVERYCGGRSNFAFAGRFDSGGRTLVEGKANHRSICHDGGKP